MYMIVILCHELKLILSHFISFSYIYKSLKFHTTPSFDILLFVILMVAAYVFMTSFTSHIKDTPGLPDPLLLSCFSQYCSLFFTITPSVAN